MSVQIISPNLPSNTVVLGRSLPSSVPASSSAVNSSTAKNFQPSEIKADTVSQLNRTYQALAETTVKKNQVADSVRQADSAMREVGRTVDKMKGTLEGIIKNYPPFPPGSEQRVKALKNFASLRQEIEKMTFPPPPSQVPKLISDPAKSPGSFSVTLDSQGTSVQLDRQQIDPGPNGLNIPILPVKPPEDSGDESIHNAISALTTAAKAVSDRRMALSENFARQALPAVVASVTAQTALSGGSQDTATLSGQSASSKSRDISEILSAIPVGISVAGDAFLKRIT